MSSTVSDSGVSMFDKSTTEFSTSGVSLKTDRSKSPFTDFKDERMSARELVSAWLDQMETRSAELLDAEHEPLEQVSISDEEMETHLAMLLHEIGDRLDNDEAFHKMLRSLDAEYDRRRLAGTVSLLGAAGLVTIMALFRC